MTAMYDFIPINRLKCLKLQIAVRLTITVPMRVNATLFEHLLDYLPVIIIIIQICYAYLTSSCWNLFIMLNYDVKLLSDVFTIILFIIISYFISS